MGTEDNSTRETNSVRSLGTRLEAVAIDGFVGKDRMMFARASRNIVMSDEWYTNKNIDIGFL